MFMLSVANIYAQEGNEAEEALGRDHLKFWRKDKFFTGGTVNMSFFNGITMLGATPHFGYSFTRFIDAAVSFNVSYISQRNYQVSGDKLRQTILAPGAFVRIYPVDFLFAHAQFDRNFIRYKYVPAFTTGNGNELYKYKANSLLLGGGYCSGRDGYGSFYYVSILWDVARDKYSPYVDNTGRAVPLIRAGVNVALFRNP